MATCLCFYHILYVEAFITLCLPMDHIWFNKSFELLMKMDIFFFKNSQRKIHDDFYIEFQQFHDFSKTVLCTAWYSMHLEECRRWAAYFRRSHACPVCDLFPGEDKTKEKVFSKKRCGFQTCNSEWHSDNVISYGISEIDNFFMIFFLFLFMDLQVLWYLNRIWHQWVYRGSRLSQMFNSYSFLSFLLSNILE